ncbi:MAG: ATP-binding protein [Candidatus Cloacimonetes bacterium]|jgi:AAA15 family ATPase/GTPase|nr:ATP-binding protein [Candidatus Cloacimonadota bacterium]MCB5269231.1 ATP-binding protein [Candidatus Cloacimonadota bacterium]MCK9333711.1 ATP-binding protein [Candidatus Cloacimonadota bacterium]MDD2543580.1 ATP-binding protein [Candidatus Cloacimonadota bacterium]MDD2682497.1 ATP-binding protein [Candidatus Cloacimonadota bacterium]
MIIRFSVANCLSFNDKTSLDLFASKVGNLKEQLWLSKSRYIPNILKSAFIFGPNAAGKSNLIKAIHYATSIVLQEPNPLRGRTTYFKLCPECPKKPSFFEFEMLIDRKIYRFGFEIKANTITREWLLQNNSTGEHEIYERTYDQAAKNQIRYGEKYEKYRDDVFISFILKGTPENKLFLSELIDRNVDIFRNVYEWFKKILVIYPDTELQSYNVLLNNEFLLNEYRRLMSICDVGIDDISVERIDADKVLDKVPTELRDKLKLDSLKNLTIKQDDRYSISLQEGSREAYKIQISHKMPSTGESVSFKISEESDGTNRLFDLIPILTLVLQDTIVLVDELDRSLHSNVSKLFIKTLFKANRDHQSQMIVTTHDATLLDVDLIRRDSIWFVRKNFKKASEIYSLYDYVKVRNDKSLQKAYLAGLYGAVPVIRSQEEEE